MWVLGDGGEIESQGTNTLGRENIAGNDSRKQTEREERRNRKCEKETRRGASESLRVRVHVCDSFLSTHC